DERGTIDPTRISGSDEGAIEGLKRLSQTPLDYLTLSEEERHEIQKLLSYLKCELNEIFKQLRVAGRRVQSKPGADASLVQREFARSIGSIKLSQDLISYLLGMPRKTQATAGKSPDSNTTPDEDFSRVDEDKSLRRAYNIITGQQVPELENSKLADDFNSAASALRQLFFDTVSDPAWKRGKALLDPRKPLPEASPRCVKPTLNGPHVDSIREYLWRYFSHFDDYDQISFPILFGTDVGESDVVEIIRISPEDAPSLINEREERQKTNGRRKLAGTALHHFGAFLDPVWRQNDILWGRLDGAERLITAMLPNPEDKKVREALITEAHSSILIEELTPPSRAAVSTLLADALVRISAGVPLKTAVAHVLKPLRGPQERSRLETIMRAGLENEQLLAFIRSGYEVDRNLDAKLMLRSISRSTQVIGKMFEDMAHQNNLEGKRLAWIARLGQIFWGLVEVAVPGSILNLFFFHWLKLLYVFEILLIIGAIALGPPNVKTFAFTALGLTVVLNLIVLLLGDYMRRRKVWWHALIAILLIVVVFFAVMGISDIWHLGWKGRLFYLMQMAWDWSSRLWS
ncbi:MAG: DUF3376 domain-containing protein, partial [Acidobacteriota bacterium]|nr:DUF3376 domain-containing protein [Acidobacteriota bacterium]